MFPLMSASTVWGSGHKQMQIGSDIDWAAQDWCSTRSLEEMLQEGKSSFTNGKRLGDPGPITYVKAHLLHSK